MDSPAAKLPGWTPEHVEKDQSDSSSEEDESNSSDSNDELNESRCNLTEESDDTENNVSSKDNRAAVVGALDAIPKTSMKQPAAPRRSKSSDALEEDDIRSALAKRVNRSLRKSASLARAFSKSNKDMSSPANGQEPSEDEDESGEPASPTRAIASEERTTNPTLDQPENSASLRLQDEDEDEDADEDHAPDPVAKSASPNQNNDLNLKSSSPCSSLIRPRTLPQVHHSNPRPLPKRFPLSPPRPSQAVNAPLLSHSSPYTSGMEDLPDVELMVAQTQPIHHESPPPKNIKRPNFLSGAPLSSPVPQIKRQVTDSPQIPSQPPKKKRKTLPTKTKNPVYIEVLDSSADEQAPQENARNVVPPAAIQPPPLPRLSLKPKRKSFPRPSTMSNAGPSRPRDLLRQRQPPKREKSYKKHPTYWRLDGNVLIQIDGLRFKLHRSILAEQAKHFEEIFSQMDEAPELILSNDEEALPLYDLSDFEITAEDFEVVLRALEDTLACFTGELPFPKLNSLLRVSTALRFPIIEKYASSALSALWSADLEDVGIDKIEYPTESLILARQCALFPVIKRALYELVRLSNFGQTKMAPGEIVSASKPRLGPHDKDLLLSAREQLGIVWRRALDVDQFPLCEGQPAAADGAPAVAAEGDAHPPCTAANRVLSLVAHHEIMKECNISDFEYDPVCGLQVLAAAPWKERGFCQACFTLRQQSWLQERERIWGKLDEWFEV